MFFQQCRYDFKDGENLGESKLDLMQKAARRGLDKETKMQHLPGCLKLKCRVQTSSIEKSFCLHLKREIINLYRIGPIFSLKRLLVTSASVA